METALNLFLLLLSTQTSKQWRDGLNRMVYPGTSMPSAKISKRKITFLESSQELQKKRRFPFSFCSLAYFLSLPDYLNSQTCPAALIVQVLLRMF